MFFGTPIVNTHFKIMGPAAFNKKNYREYLSSELSRPLNPGELVCIEISISSADYCNFVTDGCGIVLSKDELHQHGVRQPADRGDGRDGVLLCRVL